jgi:hypothetical protein
MSLDLEALQRAVTANAEAKRKLYDDLFALIQRAIDGRVVTAIEAANVAHSVSVWFSVQAMGGHKSTGVSMTSPFAGEGPQP